jgi:hypothetical protein
LLKERWRHKLHWHMFSHYCWSNWIAVSGDMIISSIFLLGVAAS